MKIKEPFLLVSGVLCMLFWLLPKTIVWKGTDKPMQWSVRIVFAGFGLFMVLLWYHLQ